MKKEPASAINSTTKKEWERELNSFVRQFPRQSRETVRQASRKETQKEVRESRVQHRAAERTDIERREMEAEGFEYIGAIDDMQMPAWMDCTWRRIACGKMSCPICGRIARMRLQHELRGGDPESMEIVVEEVGSELSETLQIIRAEAKAHGVDITNVEALVAREQPPKPTAFPLYRKLFRWRMCVGAIAKDSVRSGEAWIATESAEDLLWYTGTLLAKTYRQLCLRWEIERSGRATDSTEKNFHAMNRDYTARVLGEVFALLDRSLLSLSSVSPRRRGSFLRLRTDLTALKTRVLEV